MGPVIMTTTSGRSNARRATLLVVRWLTRLVLFVALASIIGAITILMILPRATQGSALTVLTGSMTPEIPVGSVVMVRPVDTATLRVGEVATYQKKPGVDEYITHRVTKIDRTTNPVSFTFKGDANRGPDMDPVPATAIRGEVWFHVPYLGAIRDSLHGKAGLSLLAMLVLGGYALSQVAGAMKDRRSTRRAAQQPASSSSELGDGQQLSFDQTLILVTLPTAEMSGMTPAEAARQWGAVLLASDSESFTVLLAQPRESAIGALELLVHFNPISIRISEGPNVVVGRTPGPEMMRLIDSADDLTFSTDERTQDHATA